MKNAREKLDLEEAERQAVLDAEKTAGDAVKAKKLAAVCYLLSKPVFTTDIIRGLCRVLHKFDKRAW